MRALYLIPARGGSKGLPGKNIRPLLGKPLIAWSIETALEATAWLPGKVVVSTEDKLISEIASQHGASVPFMRPRELAQDTTASMEVVLHALNVLSAQNEYFDLVVMLEPTSPQRDAQDIIAAAQQLRETQGAESIVGVSMAESMHPAFMVSLDKNKFMTAYDGAEIVVLRRQDLNPVYFFEGSLYIATVASLQEKKSFYHEKTIGYEVPKWKAFEIDDPIDFDIVECLMRKKEQFNILSCGQVK